MKAKRVGAALVGAGIIGVLSVGVLLWPRAPMDYTPKELPQIEDAVAFHEEKVAKSLAAGVPSANTERLVVHRATGSQVVFLYLHGFSASRGEGEYVLDALTAEWSANTWYARLPGHGGPGDALGTALPEQYFDTVTEAVALANRLGEKVVVVATSTGATLALWAAATFPDHIHAVILSSPLIEYADPTANLLLGSAHAERLATLVLGATRDLRERDASGNPIDLVDHPWTKVYPSKAVVHLEDVRAYAARSSVYSAVTQPTLMFYYFADEDRQDETISVAAARAAFAQLNRGSAHPQSRSVAITTGAHVLFSEHVSSDKDTIIQESRQFLREVVGLPPRERALRQHNSDGKRPPG